MLALREVFPEQLDANTPFGQWVAKARNLILKSGARDFLLREVAAA
jgi:hypothetical protein